MHVLRLGVAYRKGNLMVVEEDIMFPPGTVVSLGYMDFSMALDEEKGLFSSKDYRHVELKAGHGRLSVPRRHVFFPLMEGGYHLSLPYRVRAKVREGDGPVREVDGRELWREKATIPLDPTARGVISLPDTLIIFHFVQAA